MNPNDAYVFQKYEPCVPNLAPRPKNICLPVVFLQLKFVEIYTWDIACFFVTMLVIFLDLGPPSSLPQRQKCLQRDCSLEIPLSQEFSSNGEDFKKTGMNEKVARLKLKY
jgi:hypothetical protein